MLKPTIDFQNENSHHQFAVEQARLSGSKFYSSSIVWPPKLVFLIQAFLKRKAFDSFRGMMKMNSQPYHSFRIVWFYNCKCIVNHAITSQNT